ncbi:MAG: hypothetical protein IT289_07885 [Oligoflexia bacterium]|nr:hypothetical protein [Oligoflexia bacterium]
MITKVSCPQCGSTVDGGAGFGMVTCSTCGNIILLGAEADGGNTQAPQATRMFQPGEGGTQMAPVGTQMADFGGATHHVAQTTNPKPALGKTEDTPLPEVPQIPEVAILQEAPPEPTGTKSAIKTFVKSVKDSAPDLPTHPIDKDPNLQELSQFGNAPLEPTSQGGLMYEISVGGIDTIELRQEFLDILEDRRLGLDPSMVTSNIKDGKVILGPINPVKASVLVSHLKRLPLDIKWRSHQLIKGLAMILFLICSTMTQASEWGRHEANMKGYQSKIRTAQEEIQALVAKKNHTVEPEAKEKVLKEILQKYKDMSRMFKDYRFEREHMMFQHPEKGDKTKRQYRHMKLKSLEELEKEAGLEGQLSRLKKKVDEQFPKEEPTKAIAPPTAEQSPH